MIVEHHLPIKKVIVASSQAALGEGLYIDSDGKKVLPDMRSEEDLKNGIWEPQYDNGSLYWTITPETVSNPKNPDGMRGVPNAGAMGVPTSYLILAVVPLSEHM